MLYNRLVYELVDNNLLLNKNVEFGMELIDMNTVIAESISIAVAFIKTTVCF